MSITLCIVKVTESTFEFTRLTTIFHCIPNSLKELMKERKLKREKEEREVWGLFCAPGSSGRF